MLQSALLSHYLKTLCYALKFALGTKANDWKTDVNMNVFLEFCATAFEDEAKADSSVNGIKQVSAALVKSLRVCSSAGSSHFIMEILCLLSFDSGDGDSVCVALDAAGRVLHTVYAQDSDLECECVQFSFEMTLQRLSHKKGVKLDAAIKRALTATIGKSSVANKRDTGTHRWLRNTLLQLWSLIVHPCCNRRRSVEILSHLVSALNDVLAATREEDQPRGDRTKPGGAKLSTIPFLCVETSLMYAEVVLHMIVGDWAVAPAAVVENAANQETRPYDHLQEKARVFCMLLGVYSNHIEFLAVVLSACKEFLNLAQYRANQYVKWRHRQPVPTGVEPNGTDPGSIQHLHGLLCMMVSSVADPVATFCGTVQGTAAIEDEDDVAASWNSRDLVNRRTSQVLRMTEKVKHGLGQIAAVHNIVLSQAKDENVENDAPAVEIKTAQKGFHEIQEEDMEPTYDETTPSMTELDGPRKRPRLGDNEDDFGSEVDDSDEDNDSFEAAGNWGAEEDSLDDSSASLTLDHSTLFQAV